jgi:putative effector of murein hydrolase LrgA (UPF0299 family)
MGRLLIVFLLFLVPGLIIFIAKVQIPWEKANLFWLMAVIFHVPLILFLIAAILVEIMDRMRNKDEKFSDVK